MTDKNYDIVTEPIQVESVINRVINRNAGAVNTFIGTVREMTKGKRTIYLKYEAYESMAKKQLQRIGEEIKQQWPDAKVAITHRIGELQISDIAVVIAVSTGHRDASYKASRYAIERIKEVVPIWKQEHWEDGTSWIGDQKEQTSYPSGQPSKEI